MHTWCGKHWIWHRTQPVYVYLGADFLVATNWRAPSQTASESWHLLNFCEPPFVYWRVSITKPHIPWRRFMDVSKSDICNKDSKHLRGIEYNLRGMELCEGIRRFHLRKHRDILHPSSFIFKWVSLSQWNHCGPWKDCFEPLDPNRWKGVNLQIKSIMQCILDVANIEFETEPNPCMYVCLQRSW